jgi:uncharacterized protein YceK
MRLQPFLLAGLLVLAGCGTLVRVTDAAGHPVGKAQVAVIYPSFNGPSVITDDDGYARLRDAWFQRP